MEQQIKPEMLRETISDVPVRITVYHRGQRMLNDTHRLVMPHGEYTWYVVGEVWMDDADEFFASPFAIFEGTVWKGYTEAEDKRDWLIEQVRMNMRDGIWRTKRLPSVEPEPDTTDTEIAQLVETVREASSQVDVLEEQIKAAKDRLRILLAQRGESWKDDQGYARLMADSVRSSYDTKALDQLIISDPLRHGWLKEYRKESVVRGGIQVR